MHGPGFGRGPRTGAARVALALGAVLSVAPAIAAAQNFPPIARGASTPVQAVVGQPVDFSAAGSVDPDAGPQPLTFAWDFDDGTVATGAAPVHAFAEPRAYAVTLTVSDGADSGVAVVLVHVLRPPLPTRSRTTGPLALAPAGDRLWVANPDAGSVSRVAITGAGLELIEERPICRRPRTVSLDPDRARLYVACQGQRAVAVLELDSDRVTLVPVGAEPYGVVALAAGGALVSNQGDDTVTWIGPDLVTTATWPSADGPRAIAVTADGTRAFVTSYLSRGATATVTVHDLDAHAAIGSIALADDLGPDTASSGRGVPNLLSAAVLDPAGRQLWVGGLKSNTSAGRFRTGGVTAPANWVRGLAAPIDVVTGAELVRRRIDTNDADTASAIALSADGRHAYVTHQGAGTLSIYDLSKATLFDPGAGTSVPFESRLDVGDAPQGIALAADGTTLYITSYLAREVVAVEVRDPAAPRITARTVVVTDEPLAAEVLDGKRLFYRSREPVHSKGNYVACASCHADGGGEDGRVWDFTQGGEGLRNTIDLRGRAGLAHGLVHWSGNFDEIQDFENPIVELFGGTGLAADGAPPNPPLGPPNAGRSRALDALAAYVSTLAFTPASPARTGAGTLADAAIRGERLFAEPALRCAECHAAPRFTISALVDDARFDVGTLTAASGTRLGQPLTALDVPTLIGLWDSAPYYHDGSAPTLRAVFRGRSGTLEARLTAGLDDAQLDDLLVYLTSLDAPEPEPAPEPADHAGCGCRGSPPGAAALLIILGLVPLLGHRRHRLDLRTGERP